jgi:hypothetical protein
MFSRFLIVAMLAALIALAVSNTLEHSADLFARVPTTTEGNDQ